MASPIQWTWTWANSGRWWGMGSLVCCSSWVTKGCTPWSNWTTIFYWIYSTYFSESKKNHYMGLSSNLKNKGLIQHNCEVGKIHPHNSFIFPLSFRFHYLDIRTCVYYPHRISAIILQLIKVHCLAIVYLWPRTKFLTVAVEN